jgi:hypothetical protein
MGVALRWPYLGKVQVNFIPASLRASSDSELSRQKGCGCVAVVLYPRDAKKVVVLGVIETGKLVVTISWQVSGPFCPCF